MVILFLFLYLIKYYQYFFYDFECFFVYIIDECKMHIVLNYLMKIALNKI